MSLTLGETLQKGVEAHKAGKLQAAQTLYQAILKAQPKHPDANHNMGVMAVSVGKITESLAFFKIAVTAKPQTIQFWLSYVGALINLGRLNDAKAVLDQATLKGVKGPEFDKLQQQLTTAKATMTTAKASEGPLAGAGIKVNILDTVKLDKALRLAEKAVKEGRVADATTIYQNITSKFPQHKKALTGLAVISGAVPVKSKTLSTKQQQSVIDLFAKGQFDSALSAANQLLGQFPKSSLLHNIAGASSAGLMQYDAAILSYKKALKIEPDAPETYYNMAAAQNDKGSVEASEASYKKALTLKPDYPDAIKNLGSILHDRQKYVEARSYFDKLSDKYSVAKALECSYFLGQYDEFNKRIGSIANTNPSNIRVAAMSAYAAQQLKQPDVFPFCKTPNELVAYSNIKHHMSDADADAYIDALLAEMNNKDTSWEPKNHATKSGFHTAGNLFSSPSDALVILEDIIEKELAAFYEKFKSLGNGLTQNWPVKNEVKSWYVRMLKNGHQSAHIHSAGCVSGVVYLKTVEAPVANEGAIEFGLHGYGYPIKDAHYPRKVYQPSRGDIVLFPSSLFHQTVPVLKDVERCVIAFDLRK